MKKYMVVVLMIAMLLLCSCMVLPTNSSDFFANDNIKNEKFSDYYLAANYSQHVTLRANDSIFAEYPYYIDLSKDFDFAEGRSLYENYKNKISEKYKDVITKYNNAPNTEYNVISADDESGAGIADVWQFDFPNYWDNIVVKYCDENTLLFAVPRPFEQLPKSDFHEMSGWDYYLCKDGSLKKFICEVDESRLPSNYETEIIWFNPDCYGYKIHKYYGDGNSDKEAWYSDLANENKVENERIYYINGTFYFSSNNSVVANMDIETEMNPGTNMFLIKKIVLTDLATGETSTVNVDIDGYLLGIRGQYLYAANADEEDGTCDLEVINLEDMTKNTYKDLINYESGIIASLSPEGRYAVIVSVPDSCDYRDEFTLWNFQVYDLIESQVVYSAEAPSNDNSKLVWLPRTELDNILVK